MTRKDIAIFGGTFDPVHLGHTQMIQYFIDNYIVDEVYVLPSYNSPHKDIDKITSFDDRINMLKIATSDIKNTIISTIEEEYFKHYNSKTYTYEVLEAFKKKYLNTRIHFVVGFDSIKNINKWHRYIELIRDYWFYIFDREDSEFKTIEQKRYYLDNLGKKYGIKFIYEILDKKVLDVSSTEIRDLLLDIDKNRDLLLKYLNKDVLNYIVEKKLYGIH